MAEKVFAPYVRLETPRSRQTGGIAAETQNIAIRLDRARRNQGGARAFVNRRCPHRTQLFALQRLIKEVAGMPARK